MKERAPGVAAGRELGGDAATATCDLGEPLSSESWVCRRRDEGAAPVCELGSRRRRRRGPSVEEEEGPPGASSGEMRPPPHATLGSRRRRDLWAAVAVIQGAAPMCELGEPPPTSGSKGRAEEEKEEGPKREDLVGGGGPAEDGGAGRADEMEENGSPFLRCVVGEVNFCMPNFSLMRDPNHEMGIWFESVLLEIA